MYTVANDEASRNDDWYVGHVNFDDLWYDDWDWTWDDDWSWDQTWTSSWNERSSSSLQDSQNKTSVSVTELPGSRTSGSGGKVSAVTSGPPPGTERKTSPRTTGNTCRSKSMFLSAITLGTFGVGSSALVGPGLTPTCEISGSCSCNFDVGLNHVNLPDFEDMFTDQHLTVAPTGDTSWILFDSGAAASCCPKNFAPEWPILLITGTKPPLLSVTGHPLKIYGRKLVGMKVGDCDFYLHLAPYYKVLQSSTPYYKVLQSSTPYYKVLHNTISYYKAMTKYYKVFLRTPYNTVLLCTTPLYTIPQSTTKYYTVRRRTTKYYTVLLRTTKLLQRTTKISPYNTVLLCTTP